MSFRRTHSLTPDRVMERRVLELALEMVHVLTGADHIALKRFTDSRPGKSAPCVSVFCRMQDPSTEPPPPSLAQETQGPTMEPPPPSLTQGPTMEPPPPSLTQGPTMEPPPPSLIQETQGPTMEPPPPSLIQETQRPTMEPPPPSLIHETQGPSTEPPLPSLIQESWGPIMEHPSPSLILETRGLSMELICERHNEQKILALTNTIIQLLTGEVPVRCEDVTAGSFGPKWECRNEEMDSFNEAITMKHRSFSSRDVSKARTVCEGGNCAATHRPTSSQIKEEQASFTDGDPSNAEIYLPANHSETEYESVIIKEEPDSREEENLSDMDMKSSPEHVQTQHPFLCIKEESALCEEGAFTDVYPPSERPQTRHRGVHGRDAPASLQEANGNNDLHSPEAGGSSLGSKAKSLSCDEGDYSNTDIYFIYNCPNCHVTLASPADLIKHQVAHRRGIHTSSEHGEQFQWKSVAHVAQKPTASREGQETLLLDLQGGRSEEKPYPCPKSALTRSSTSCYI